MKPWLRGDLSGVSAREELPVLRDAVLGAAHRGEDTSALFSALADLDPVACAELAAGPRAVAHPQAVRGALAAAAALEGVLAPSGLYARLADLAPEAGGDVLAVAASRHPTAAWLVGLSRRCDPVPGRVHLRAASGTEAFASACALHAGAGHVPALVDAAVSGRHVEPVLALYRAGDVDGCVRAAAALLDASPGTPVVPWLAAVHGPELETLLLAVATAVSTRAARDALRLVCVDFPRVTARLAGPNPAQ